MPKGMLTNGHIRQAIPEDAATIARVHIDSWRETYDGIVAAEYLNKLSYSDRAARWQDNLAHCGPDVRQGPETWVLEAPAEGQGRLLRGFVTFGPHVILNLAQAVNYMLSISCGRHRAMALAAYCWTGPVQG